MTTRAERKLATHARLVEVARATFRSRGYDGTTLQAVAEAAGVAVGTVVAHFPDKPRLVLAAFHAELEGAAAEGLRAFAATPDLLDAQVALARPLYRMYAAEPALFRRMVQEALFVPADGPMAGQLQGFLAAVASGIAARRPELDAALYARGYFADYFAALVAGLSGALPAPPGVPPHEPWLAALRALAATRLGSVPCPTP